MKFIVYALGGAWLLSSAAFPAAAGAETLADAIAAAYRDNPTLQQQRALLRSSDENYVQAAAGLRPTVQTQLYEQYNDARLGKSTIAANSIYGPTPTRNESNAATGQVVVSFPVFTGGKVTAQIRQARAQIGSGREGLRASEGDLLLNVIGSYVSVRRDQQILTVRATALQQFVYQHDEAVARRAAGDATLTDEAQADAQLQAERANYSDAQQQLQVDRAEYANLVGHDPGQLAAEPDLPNLPADVDRAFDIAILNSPEVRAAVLSEEASRQGVAAARAQFNPSVSLQGSYGYTGVGVPLNAVNLERDFTVQAVVTQPIFTGGLYGSELRRALEQNNADRSAIEIARREVVQNVANGWNAILTARNDVATQQHQVDAARLTLEGMQQEYRAGLRSTFEVLYAAQTYRDAQISYLSARYNYYIGEATILRYIGRLEAADLTSGTPLYDPVLHFNKVRDMGATPLDPIGRLIDSLAAPDVTQRSLQAPGRAVAPSFAAPASPVPTDALPATHLVNVPLPGTAAP